MSAPPPPPPPKQRKVDPGWNDPPMLNYSATNPPPKSRITNKRVAFPIHGGPTGSNPSQPPVEPPANVIIDASGTSGAQAVKVEEKAAGTVTAPSHGDNEDPRGPEYWEQRLDKWQKMYDNSKEQGSD